MVAEQTKPVGLFMNFWLQRMVKGNGCKTRGCTLLHILNIT